MLKYFLGLIIFICSNSFAQRDYSSLNIKKKIILFGETHFVKEKYDEIKAFTFERINGLNEGDKISFFFELPFTINYAFNQIEEFGDTTIFYEWFNNLYQTKNKKPSYFWIDYRDFILDLIKYADKKGVELELKGIDTELELRRTVFILSTFDNKIGPKIDSLLNLSYIYNNKITRNILIKYVNKLSMITDNKNELMILNKLKKSLTIDCTICLDRDYFMYKNFIQNYDSTNVITFGTLGLNHIISKHDFTTASNLFRMKYKFDTTGYKSFYDLFNNDFKAQIFKIGIIALNQKLKFSTISKPKDYSYIMNKEERRYIEKLLKNDSVYRINPYKHKELRNLSSQLNYLIIYKNSHFRWQ